jgi:hypothetical protein
LSAIHYPHHPLYGQTVAVVRRSVSFGSHQVQVALASGYQLVIPEWMLDEERCQGMEIVAHPTVALPALLVLRSLWEIPDTPDLPETVQVRCQELLSHMLLAAVSGSREEESDEREDTADPHRA